MTKEVIRKAARERGLTPEAGEYLQETRGVTSDGIAALPDSQIRSGMRRLDFPNMPNARLAWRQEQSLGDDGQVPQKALMNALREVDSLRLRTFASSVAGIPTGERVAPSTLAAPGVAGLEIRTWEPLGPVNIGGRTRSIVVHPNNSEIVWAASVAGGIWRSDDGGQGWLPVDDFMANLAVTTLVIDPTDSQRLFAGTGEGFGNGDALRGGGIFETRNGQDWRQIPQTTGSHFQEINRLAISADGEVLLAATSSGLYRSIDENKAAWDQVVSGPIADVKCHPTDPNKALAGSRRDGRSWWTENGGITWQESTHNADWDGRVEICYALADPSYVYASIDMQNGTIWRSTDGGHSFSPRSSLNKEGGHASYLGDQGWYANVLWAGDPTDKDLVIAGGLDLWRSTDGGNSLSAISTWWDKRSVHADHHAITPDPGYDGVANRRVWFGNDGGVYVTDDLHTVGNEAEVPHVAGWASRNNGYAVTQFYGAAANSNTGVIVGGTQDCGTLAYDMSAGDMIWRDIFGGDGGFCAADATDSQVFYGEYVFLNIHRNLDGATTSDSHGDRYISGQFWNQGAGQWQWKSPPYLIPDAKNQHALFIAPFVMDPNNSSSILAGGESLWRTDDAKTANTPTKGPSWRRVKQSIGSKISAIAFDPSDPATVWIGHQNGRIYRTLASNAVHPSWSRMGTNGAHTLNASRMCTRILVSPHDSSLVLASFGGFQQDNLWLTADAGVSWHALSGLPAAPIRGLAIHPSRAGMFYVGTEVGVFASEDSGASWSPTNEGPANVSVDDLFWIDERLICVTHGRGLFAIDLADL